MKLPQNTYSRLTLITCVVLAMGSALVYAFTPLVLTDADGGKPLTGTLMKTIMTNVNEVGAKLWTLTSGKMCTSDGTKIDCTSSIPTGGGTVISLKCGWWSVQSGIGSCTPPTCPTGWVNLGVGNSANGIGDSAYAYVVGNSERWCFHSNTYALQIMKCGWWPFQNSIGSCTPPTCPIWWTSIGIGWLANGIGKDAYQYIVGTSERICIK